MSKLSTPSDRAQKVTVDILNREFAVACTPSEKPALLEAAKLLDERARKLRSQGASTSQFDQLLVVVALNLCNELKNNAPTNNGKDATLENPQRIKQLIDKIDQVLDE